MQGDTLAHFGVRILIADKDLTIGQCMGSRMEERGGKGKIIQKSALHISPGSSLTRIGLLRLESLVVFSSGMSGSQRAQGT